jgi:hypothetical protein
LLENLLLLIKGFDLLLDVLEIGLLGLQRLDLIVLGIELLLPRVEEKTKNENAEYEARANKQDGKRCPRIDRPARRLGPNLSEKVYANHG